MYITIATQKAVPSLDSQAHQYITHAAPLDPPDVRACLCAQAGQRGRQALQLLLVTGVQRRGVLGSTVLEHGQALLQGSLAALYALQGCLMQAAAAGGAAAQGAASAGRSVESYALRGAVVHFAVVSHSDSGTVGSALLCCHVSAALSRLRPPCT